METEERKNERQGKERIKGIRFMKVGTLSANK